MTNCVLYSKGNRNTNIPGCINVAGQAIDDLIEKLVLEKMSPSVLEVALNIQDKLKSRLEEADHLRFQHVEKIRYDMDLAKKRFMSVDPLNRLVADELEVDWNHCIKDYKTAQDEYEKKRQHDRLILGEEQRKRILELASDFPKLWNAETTTAQDRKRMVRLIVSDVTLTRGDTISVKIRFKGGSTEIHELPLAQNYCENKKHSPEVIKEIDRLLNLHTHTEVADKLNRAGFQSGTGKTFSRNRVSKIIRAYKLPSRFKRLKQRGFLTIAEICDKYNVARNTVFRWRKSDRLKCHRLDDVRYLYECKNIKYNTRCTKEL